MKHKQTVQMMRQKNALQRTLALFLGLCMILNYAVPADMVFRPIRALAETLYFETPQTDKGNAVEITNYNIKIKSKSELFEAKSGTNPRSELTFIADPDTTLDLTMMMDYEFKEKAVTDAIANNGGYIYYELPENLTFNQNYTGSGSIVKDAEYGNKMFGDPNAPSGYYSIWNGVRDDGTKTKPLLVIRFTPDYINYFKSDNYVAGHIEFDGRVARQESIEGDQTLDFATVRLSRWILPRIR